MRPLLLGFLLLVSTRLSARNGAVLRELVEAVIVQPGARRYLPTPQIKWNPLLEAGQERLGVVADQRRPRLMEPR